MDDVKRIADEAEVIIEGYAFSKYMGGYRVLNLNAPDKAAVFASWNVCMFTPVTES